MSVIKIPQAESPASDASAFREMGYISYAARQASSGNALAALGERMQALSLGMERYRDRQIQFANHNASIDVDQERKAFASQQYRRTDLHRLGDDGLQGYDRAPDEYAEYIEKLTAKASEQIHPNYRDDWLQAERQKNESLVAEFRVAMIDQQTKQNAATALSYVGKQAMGDAERNIPPDPNGAMQTLLTHADIVPSVMRDKFISDGMQTVVYGTMNSNPDQAIELLKTNKDYIEPPQWAHLMSSARSAKATREAQLKDAHDALLEKNDADLSGRVILAEQGLSQENRVNLIVELAQKAQNQEISPVRAGVLAERLKQKREPNLPEQRTAFAAMSRATILLEDGKIDRQKWDAAFDAHANDLPGEKVYSFLQRAEEVYTGRAKEKANQYTETRKYTEKLATETLGYFYPQVEPLKEGEKPKEGASEDLLLAAAVGDVMERMEKVLAARPANQPVDELTLRREAIRVVGEVYEQERKKLQNEAKPKLGERLKTEDQRLREFGRRLQEQEDAEQTPTQRVAAEKAKLDAEIAGVDVDKEMDYVPPHVKSRIKADLKKYPQAQWRKVLDNWKKRIPRPAEGQELTVIIPPRGGQ